MPTQDDCEDVQPRYIAVNGDIEDLEQYRPGGLHPLALGNELKGGRYTICHKLGYGASATVWLARDNDNATYVAVKVHSDQASKRTRELAIHRYLSKHASIPKEIAIARILDHFRVSGPNGCHTCLVFELCGPNFDSLTGIKIKPNVIRNLASQITNALAFLHKSEVAFGDLSPANILLKATDFSQMSLEEIYTALGKPTSWEVKSIVGEQQLKHAPQFAHPPLYFTHGDAQRDNLRLQYLRPRALLTDLAEAVLLTDSEQEQTGVHLDYAAPEFMFDINRKHTKASDIWALACCFYQMRSGHLLLEHAGTPRSFAIQTQHLIGELPNSLANCEEFIAGDCLIVGQEYLASSTRTLRHKLENIGNWDAWHLMSAEEKRDNLLLRQSEEYADEPQALDIESMLHKGGPPPAKLSSEEFNDFYDLLSKMLHWLPEQRITVKEVIEHPWLNKQYNDLDDPNAAWIERYDTINRKYEGRVYVTPSNAGEYEYENDEPDWDTTNAGQAANDYAAEYEYGNDEPDWDAIDAAAAVANNANEYEYENDEPDWDNLEEQSSSTGKLVSSDDSENSSPVAEAVEPTKTDSDEHFVTKLLGLQVPYHTEQVSTPSQPVSQQLKQIANEPDNTTIDQQETQEVYIAGHGTTASREEIEAAGTVLGPPTETGDAHSRHIDVPTVPESGIELKYSGLVIPAKDIGFVRPEADVSNDKIRYCAITTEDTMAQLKDEATLHKSVTNVDTSLNQASPITQDIHSPASPWQHHIPSEHFFNTNSAVAVQQQAAQSSAAADKPSSIKEENDDDVPELIEPRSSNVRGTVIKFAPGTKYEAITSKRQNTAPANAHAQAQETEANLKEGLAGGVIVGMIVAGVAMLLKEFW